MRKNHYTTTQAARLLSVSADTVLKWVKAGKIPSYQTPGGHNRIPAEAVEALLPGGGAVSLRHRMVRTYDHCWDFYADQDGVRAACKDCVAYKSGARRCYEMRSIPEEFGHLRLFCETSCEDCEFYQLTHGRERRRVLVVSRQETWLVQLAEEAAGGGLKLTTAASEYACGSVIEDFRPDFIVLDASFGTIRTRDICRHLNEDARIPFTRIILTSRQARWAEECAQEVCGWIEKPFTIAQLGAFIESAARTEISTDIVA
ncbi:MAG: excisionase family DNA-binding protein [bacterium]|nr:excisionase family DNA-binding protein [bacterium]